MELAMTKEWAKRFLFALPGLIGLGGSIGLLQNIARASIDNVNDLVFVDNWIPLYAVLSFALGWFTTHWIETALLKKQVKIVKILFAALLLEGIIFGVYFRFFVDYEIINRFGFAVQQLIISGAFLRYSTFSNEASATQRKILYGEKIETSG